MSKRSGTSFGAASRLGCAGAVALFVSVAVTIRAEPVEIESTYTLIGQSSNDDSLDDSTTGSLDLYLTWNRGAGALEVYAEGNTSLRDNGVATRLPRSNADAGTALDTDRSGRVQLSELKYRYTWSSTRSLSVGLLDPSAYLDSTRINNDENLQFLGASFVNNPTIEFPDYTLGVSARLSSAEALRRWNLVLAASNGIADNPNLSYSQLLNVTEDQKGVFAGAEAAWPAERYLIRSGVWVNTAEHETLDESENDARNYGLYAAIGSSWGRWAANLRLGAANPEVSLAEGFASLSFQREQGKRTLGFAAARTWVSSEGTLNVPNHSVHVESYARFRLGKSVYLTPSIQYLVNGGFDSSGPSFEDDVTVLSLRLHHVFFRRNYSLGGNGRIGAEGSDFPGNVDPKL